MQSNITYFNKNNIIQVVKNLTPNSTIITDNLTLKQLIEKYNSSCIIQYHARKYLHQAIQSIHPDIVFLLHNSGKTISFIQSTNPNIIVYTLELSESEQHINNLTDELEDLQP